MIVPTLWKFLEKDTKESIARGPELRDWVTDKLLVGDERLDSIKRYEMQKERLQYLKIIASVKRLMCTNGKWRIVKVARRPLYLA